MADDICGHPTADGEPCQHPPSNGDSCWLPSHGGDAASDGGRPKALDDTRKRQIIFTAVSAGLSIERQAALAGVSTDTLRRYACCLDELREPELTTDDPCEFCESYAQADARGALEVIRNCRPEYRAAATFGIVEKKGVEHSTDDDTDALVEVNFSDADT